MEYYSVIKNETGLCVETWMDLKTVIQSEVSQKEKIKYHILSIQVESEKIVFTKQKQRQRHREQMFGYQGVRGGGMNWEIGIEMYTLLYKIDN